MGQKQSKAKRISSSGKRTLLSGNLLLDAFSVVIAAGHLHHEGRKALHLTCRDLRSLVNRHVNSVYIRGYLDPKALEASGILGNNIQYVTFSLKFGREEHFLELAEVITARCSQSVRHLSFEGCECSDFIFTSIYRTITSVSWPMLRLISIGSKTVSADVLFPPGSASLYPKLESAHLCFSQYGLRSLNDAIFPPHMNDLLLTLHEGCQLKPGCGPEHCFHKLVHLQSLTLLGFNHCQFLEDPPLGALTKVLLTLTEESEQEAATCLVPLFSRPWPRLLTLDLEPAGISFPLPPVGSTTAEHLFPNLVCLILCNTNIDWEAFKAMKFTRLRSLSLVQSREWQPTTEDMVEVLNTLPELRELKLEMSDSIMYGANTLKELLVSEFATRLAVLRIFYEDFELEDIHVIQAIAQHCKALRVLDIRGVNEEFGTAAMLMVLGCGAAGALPLLRQVGIHKAEDEGMEIALQKVWPGVLRMNGHWDGVEPGACRHGTVDYVYTD